MADFAPQRGGQPTRSRISVAELLGRQPGSADAARDRAPHPREVVSVSALIRREGRAPHTLGRPVNPRSGRAFPGLSSSPRRKLASTASAMIAVGSLAGAAALLSNTAGGPAGSGAWDGGYPESKIGAPDLRSPHAAFGSENGTALAASDSVAPVAFPTPLSPADLLLTPLTQPTAASGQNSNSPRGTPTSSVPGAATTSTGSGGVVGGAVNGLVGGGGEVVGGTVGAVGDALGPLGTPVSALGDTVTRTTAALGNTVDATVGAVGSVAQGGVRTVSTAVDRTGDALGSTVSSVGRALPLPLVGPVTQGLGSAVSQTSKSLADTVDRTVGGLTGGLLGGAKGSSGTGGAASKGGKPATSGNRSTQQAPTAGSALSSLTKPITHNDATRDTVRSVTGTVGSLLGQASGASESKSSPSNSSGKFSSSRSGDSSRDSGRSGKSSSSGNLGGGLLGSLLGG